MLLLFAIGLKLDIRTLVRREIWLTTVVHLAISVAIAVGFLGLLAVVGFGIVSGESFGALALVGFALSFSSTVFVVKVLDDRSDTTSLYGRIAVGVLVMQDVAAVVFLVSFGWLSGLGLSKLYKIVPFLTWLECYGPIIGKAPTPRVQDLVAENRAIKWFILYFFAVWAATAALFFGAPMAFRGAAAVMLVATIGIVVQLVMSRRLVDVKAALRLPDGVRRPRLLYSRVP